MRTFKLMLAGALALVLGGSAWAADNTVTAKNASGATVTFCSKDVGSGVMAACSMPIDTSGAKINVATAGNQTSVIADPGSDATKAIAVQGVTNGTAIPITAASLPLPSGAAADATVGTTNTNLGAPGATACATDTGSCSLNALAQRIAQRLTTLNTTLGSPFQAGASPGALVAGTAIIGKVGIDQTTDGTTNKVYSNLSQIGGNAVATGNGVTGTGSSRVTIASDNTPFPIKIDQTTPGTTNAVSADVAKVAGTTTAVNTGNASAGTQRVVLATDQPAVTTNPAPTTGMGCTLSGTVSTAGTNSASAKGSAGTLCGGVIINTTATLGYLRLYNSSSAPTCSSATGFVLSIPIPASTSGAGTLLDFGSFGAAFSTGIGFCFTGGGTSTDNTNGPAGVYINVAYK